MKNRNESENVLEFVKEGAELQQHITEQNKQLLQIHKYQLDIEHILLGKKDKYRGLVEQDAVLSKDKDDKDLYIKVTVEGQKRIREIVKLVKEYFPTYEIPGYGMERELHTDVQGATSHNVKFLKNLKEALDTAKEECSKKVKDIKDEIDSYNATGKNIKNEKVKRKKKYESCCSIF